MDMPAVQTQLRILLLEDEPTDAELVESELREAGLSFVSRRVDTREAFMQALEEFKPDIILADYKLPAFDGASAVKIVRQHYPDVPVVMVTGAVGDEKAVELLGLGARDYILKDRLARLGPAVQRALSAEHGIRARKAAEKALRESEAELRTLVEHSPVAMLVDVGVDAGEKIIMMNRKFTELFGYTMEDVPDVLHWWPLAYPDEKYREEIKTEWTRRVEKAVQDHIDIEPMETTVTCKLGLLRYVRVSLASIGSRNIITFENLTERKRLTDELKETADRNQAIMETANDAIICMKPDGTIHLWNHKAEEMFGYTALEAVGQKMHQLITPAHYREKEMEGLRQFTKAGTGPIVGKTQELTALRKDGVEFPVELSVSAMNIRGEWHATGIIRDITGRKQVEAAITHANRALATLSAVNKSLVRASDEQELLQSICQSIVEQRGYRMVWVGYKRHDENKSVEIVASAGYDEGYLDKINVSWAETERGMGPTGRAIRGGTTQLCQDFTSDPRHLPWREAALERGYAASIALPLANGEVFGALTVYAAEVNAFTPDEVSLLEEMANDLAFGVRSLHIRQERDLALKQSQQRLEQLQDNLEDSVRAIASIVEMRDPYTAGHQIRVAGLAAAIAKQMGLPDEQIHGIHLAGIVHDLGKIQVPAEILSKPGRLSVIEYGLIQTHPQAGYDILKDINFPWPISQMVLQHHERLDGSGYPQGLKGDQIIIGARILSVADVVEAMSSHRPYRVGLGVEAALGEITKQRGIHFDPQVVDACLTLFREQGYRFA
ncbi:MAG: PAS domain S-box protein [Gallionella sp.]|nr:PAS domain S-box protein [Gallionella sp.]